MAPTQLGAFDSHLDPGYSLIGSRSDSAPLDSEYKQGPEDVNEDIEFEENPAMVNDKGTEEIEYVYPTPASDLYFSEVDKTHSTTRSPGLMKSIRAFHRYLGRKQQDGSLQIIAPDSSLEETREGYIDQWNRFGAVIDKAKLILDEDEPRPRI